MVEQKDLSSLERGHDLSRIGAFTDGVFAIAITLLVLQLDLPANVNNASELWDALGDQSYDFVAFAISFAVIGRYWFLNHRYMRMVGEFDSRLIVLNLAFLATIVLLPFSSQLMGEYGNEIPAAVVIYIGNLALATLVAGLMYRHAYRSNLVLPEYRVLARLGWRSVVVIAAIFVATMPLAFVLGPYTPLAWIVLMRFNPYDRARKTVVDVTSRELRDGDSGKEGDDEAGERPESPS